MSSVTPLPLLSPLLCCLAVYLLLESHITDGSGTLLGAQLSLRAVQDDPVAGGECPPLQHRRVSSRANTAAYCLIRPTSHT